MDSKRKRKKGGKENKKFDGTNPDSWLLSKKAIIN
jgi:hypothetical protein